MSEWYKLVGNPTVADALMDRLLHDGHRRRAGCAERRTSGSGNVLSLTPLLKQGRQLGVSAKLVSKLNYLWHSCTGELSEQNDPLRLTCALETAKGMHWNYRLLNDRE